MYKFLPILLFAFLFAEENLEPLFIQPDSLDFVWADGKIDEMIDNSIAEISKIINKDNLIINTESRIINVFISESLSEIVKRMKEDIELDGDKVACPPKVVPSVKLVFVQTERNKEYDT